MNQKKKKTWPWVVAILVVLAVIVYLILPKGMSFTGLNTRAVTTETGSLSVTVTGTGNLEYDEAVAIKMPSGVVVDTVIVESGDTVSIGDMLATVDALSLQTQINSVQSQINSLDAQIGRTKENPETETIKASLNGRVKRIYAEVGAAVADITLENSALLLLSTDGKMAVDIESQYVLSVGDKVDVILENGNTKEGAVEKAEGATYTITLTDNGPTIGESVSIASADGDVLGMGELYIHRPIKIVAAYGTVKSVHVSENEKVSAGKTLVTLENLPVSADFEQQLRDREELLSELEALIALSKTNALTASFDGVILSVNVADGETVGGASSSSSSTASTTANSSTSYSGVSTSTQAQAVSSSVEENLTTVFTAAPSENVLLSVNVDELDILSIDIGMEVQVAFDAIDDQIFTGKIVKIADSAAASGGVAKYAVKVLLQKDASMRAGMNATATILVETKDNILLIPVIALQENGGRVYVYTQQNSETDELSGAVDVTTGISDGENVEITSGLSQGGTVYYRVTDSETQVSLGMGGGFGDMGGGFRGQQ